MAHPRRSPCGTFTGHTDSLIRLWLLRILVPLGGQGGLIGERGLESGRLAAAVGLSEIVDQDGDEYCARAALATLRRLHRTAEAQVDQCEVPQNLAVNVARLRSLVGLTDTDCRILEFAVLINTDRLLDDTADLLGNCSSVKVFDSLAVILGLPEAEVRESLRPAGLLARTGLVNVGKNGAGLLRGKLDLLSENFADRMLTEQDDPITLLRETIAPGAAPLLDYPDFAHIDQTLRILRPYLRHALEVRRHGVNIFVHGDPGTGKTQLARLLAKDAEAELFEVANEDADGDPVNGERRLRAFRAAQSFFPRRRALILFDEIEDVFNDGDRLWGRKSTAQRCKAWVNRMLEENAVPTIWLSNEARCMDPAFIRRFDVVLELKVPGCRQRACLVAQACGDLLRPEDAARVSAAESLAPALITRAAAVIRSIETELPPDAHSAALVHLVDSTLIAQGHAGLATQDATRLPDHYDPLFVNVDADLAAIAAGVERSASARVCLYGPPGTGKTAFGRWLAERLGRPLHARKVSDLVSPYVGQTERNLASAFREAATEAAVLLLDEVDSFLQDRRTLQRSWEITAVNEMLTQMEGFAGVFIASTNLMDGLDQAALRRFDLKLRFGYLRAEQAWKLFEAQCTALVLGSPPAALRRSLEALTVLTPGDFASVARQHRFRALADPAALLSALSAECGMKKDGQKRVMGFV